MTTVQHLFRLRNFAAASLLLVPLIATCCLTASAQIAPSLLIAQVDGLLRTGNRGDAVVRLQTQLRNLGFYQGTIDGDFGSGTEAAVIQFQRSQNLTPDGVVGPQTTAALDRLTGYSPSTPNNPSAPTGSTPTGSTLPRGDRFSVLELQRRLRDRGFYQGAVDGVAGAQTRNAIRAAQREYGLDENDILNGRF